MSAPQLVYRDHKLGHLDNQIRGFLEELRLPISSARIAGCLSADDMPHSHVALLHYSRVQKRILVVASFGVRVIRTGAFRYTLETSIDYQDLEGIELIQSRRSFFATSTDLKIMSGSNEFIYHLGWSQDAYDSSGINVGEVESRRRWENAEVMRDVILDYASRC